MYVFYASSYWADDDFLVGEFKTEVDHGTNINYLNYISGGHLDISQRMNAVYATIHTGK